MNKNTRAKLTLILNVNKRNYALVECLESIQKQNDKNFNLIIVLNGTSSSDKQIVADHQFPDIADCDYQLISESMGDSFALKAALRKIKTPYFYFFDCNVILNPDFISTINNFAEKHPDADIISFFGVPNFYFKEEYREIETLSDDFCVRPYVFFNNKILKVSYFDKLNIDLPNFKHYPLYLHISLIQNNPKWYSLGRQICFGSQKQFFQFNTYDLFEEQFKILELSKIKPFSEHKEEIEYLTIIGLLRNYLYTVFYMNPWNFLLQKEVIENVDSFLDENYPHWRNNKWLWSKQNLNDQDYLTYLREFKPSTLHVRRAMRAKSFKQRANGTKK